MHLKLPVTQIPLSAECSQFQVHVAVAKAIKP